MQTSVTTPSSTKLRLTALTPRIRGLGDRPLFELFCELTSLSSQVMDRLELYGRIDLDALQAFDGVDLPPPVVRIK
jgi:hypothetical protein